METEDSAHDSDDSVSSQDDNAVVEGLVHEERDTGSTSAPESASNNGGEEFRGMIDLHDAVNQGEVAESARPRYQLRFPKRYTGNPGLQNRLTLPASESNPLPSVENEVAQSKRKAAFEDDSGSSSSGSSIRFDNGATSSLAREQYSGAARERIALSSPHIFAPKKLKLTERGKFSWMPLSVRRRMPRGRTPPEEDESTRIDSEATEHSHLHPAGTVFDGITNVGSGFQSVGAGGSAAFMLHQSSEELTAPTLRPELPRSIPEDNLTFRAPGATTEGDTQDLSIQDSSDHARTPSVIRMPNESAGTDTHSTIMRHEEAIRRSPTPLPRLMAARYGRVTGSAIAPIVHLAPSSPAHNQQNETSIYGRRVSPDSLVGQTSMHRPNIHQYNEVGDNRETNVFDPRVSHHDRSSGQDQSMEYRPYALDPSVGPQTSSQDGVEETHILHDPMAGSNDHSGRSRDSGLNTGRAEPLQRNLHPSAELYPDAHHNSAQQILEDIGTQIIGDITRRLDGFRLEFQQDIRDVKQEIQDIRSGMESRSSRSAFVDQDGDWNILTEDVGFDGDTENNPVRRSAIGRIYTRAQGGASRRPSSNSQDGQRRPTTSPQPLRNQIPNPEVQRDRTYHSNPSQPRQQPNNMFNNPGRSDAPSIAFASSFRRDSRPPSDIGHPESVQPTYGTPTSPLRTYVQNQGPSERRVPRRFMTSRGGQLQGERPHADAEPRQFAEQGLGPVPQTSPQESLRAGTHQSHRPLGGRPGSDGGRNYADAALPQYSRSGGNRASDLRGPRNARREAGPHRGPDDEGWDTEEPENLLATLLPKRRPDWRNECLKDCREAMRILMRREEGDSAFNLNLVPSPEEVAAYRSSQGRCCTDDNFRLDLNGTPKNDWNKSCYRVFERYFLEMRYACTDTKEIEKAFFSHVKYLQDLWRKEVLSQHELEARQQAKTRFHRKQALMERRVSAALSRNDTVAHALILRRLGAEGMSSDESDHENGVAQYRILIHPWRHPHLTPWIRTFDALHRRTRFAPVMHNTRGAHPRNRFPSAIRSNSQRPAPPGLPINAYNPEWYNRLAEWDQEDLRADEPYEFSHTATTLQIAQEFIGGYNASRSYV